MKKLTLDCVGSLEDYLQNRSFNRSAVIAHKKNRRISLGPNISLHFEDFLTMRHQVQEIMRAENLTDVAAIQHEIDVYNPLIPDGCNLKCTLMLEFPDPDERQRQLRQLIGIETSIFIRIGDCAAVAAIADEDAQRCTPDKTSAVHFLRYEFTDAMINAAKGGANWTIFSEHPAYCHVLSALPAKVATALSLDFD